MALVVRSRGEGSNETEVGNDPVLLALVAQLALDDLDEIGASRKGKARKDTCLSDEELAIQLFAEEAHALLDTTKDLVYARSVDSALDTDRSLLQELERAEACAREDHEFAVALSQGRQPPRPSMASLRQSGESSGTLLTILPSLDSNASRTIATSSKASTSRSIVPRKTETCVFCREVIGGVEIRAPCGHFWDSECVVELFRAATTDESLYPPRCCQRPFVVSGVKHLLGAQLAATFEKKSIEFSTTDRVYCHRSTCSLFLGPATSTRSIVTCLRCHAQTCGRCKQPAHTSASCPTDDTVILALAEEAGWKRCPGCRHLVELSQGCYHMTCRCRKQFCYVCTETWKNCNCPQWDETLLLRTAQDRVQRELPAGPLPAPIELVRLVEGAVNRLRVDHDCQHAWRYRPGGGQCENCYHYLGVFLLNCCRCHLNVCVRCRRNRL